MSRLIKVEEPETARQARRWTEYNNAAVDLGMCYPCAAQHAYGRVHGWRQVKPPCGGCIGIAYAVSPAWPLALSDRATSARSGPAPIQLPAMPEAGARALLARRPEPAAA
jgi:hypothetical protein